MRRRTTWVAAGATVVALGPWLPGWLTAANLDVWNTPALRRQVDANRREEARLDGEIADIQAQVRGKERLVEELIAGRITLTDATDQFEAMLAAQPRTANGLRLLYPDAASDRERVARHVVDYSRARLTDPAERDRLGARMTMELSQLFPHTRAASSDPMG
ncbi:MAG TPA: hypothetical protein VD866_03605 [Urbifossiella sp.]|nr:hypothetical protein [Urbifossiella sp.]